MDNSESKEKILKSKILKLTKRIGESKKENDFAEAENARVQRGKLVKELVEKFDTYYWVEGGKSKFGSAIEAEQFYGDPDNVKKMHGHQAIEIALHTYNKIRSRKIMLDNIKDDASFRKEVMEQFNKELTHIEQQVNKVEEAIGASKTDFTKMPSKNTDLDGIDFSSLSE